MSKRRRETWTFQPDEVAIALLSQLFGNRKPSRGERTALINEALRFRYPESAVIMAQKELKEASERLSRMKQFVSEIKRISLDKTHVFDAADSKLRRDHKAARPTDSKVPLSQKPPPEKAQ